MAINDQTLYVAIDIQIYALSLFKNNQKILLLTFKKEKLINF